MAHPAWYPLYYVAYEGDAILADRIVNDLRDGLAKEGTDQLNKVFQKIRQFAHNSAALGSVRDVDKAYR